MFKRDLLLIDFEATGLDVQKHEPIQLAAIVLDRKTLKEKRSFVTYIKPRRWNNWDPEAMAINNIDKSVLTKAPTTETVRRKFDEFAGKRPLTLAYYGGSIDIPFLKTIYTNSKRKYPFDYHALDLWGICLIYLARKNSLKNNKRAAGFSLEDLMRLFKIPAGSRHDALFDCRVEAEVFRHIYNSLFKR